MSVKTEIQAAIDDLSARGTSEDTNVQKALDHLHAAMKEADVPDDHRQRLPDERTALTHHFEIANHDGYITVGHYPDGTPGEVFLKISKQGGTLSGLLDSFAIMFSIALQYGAPLHVITDKLSGSRFEPSGFSTYPGIGYSKSLVDYVARWMAIKYLSPEKRPEVPPSLLSDPPLPGPAEEEAIPSSGPAGAVVGCDGPPCGRCGNLTQKMGSGDCWACSNCGATSGSRGGR